MDLTSIIIPILALIGLSLLFPTYVSVAAGRRKRSADGESFFRKPSLKTKVKGFIDNNNNKKKIKSHAHTHTFRWLTNTLCTHTIIQKRIKKKEQTVAP